jgi:hypothetical protein
VFVQVITGRVVDRDGLVRAQDRWDAQVRPGAVGFLGTTAGTTGDGRFVAFARFESAEAARRNSERPEQGEWWSEVEKSLDDIGFVDSTDVHTLLGGGSDAAGFVQVMRGRITDRGRFDELERRSGDVAGRLKAHRPELLGDLIVLHEDGTFTEAAYFTDEAEARQGEAKPMPDDVRAEFEQWGTVFEVDEYLDLTDVWVR